MKLPKTRPDLLIQDLNEEALVYDNSNNKSYCLNSTARTVFSACDGAKTLADVGLPEDVVYLALDELKRNDLLATAYVSLFAGLSRREVIRKVELASMVALPLISGLTAPNAANTASGCASSNAAVSTTITNPSNDTTTNQNRAGQNLAQ